MGAQMVGYVMYGCEHGTFVMAAGSDNPCRECAKKNAKKKKLNKRSR